MPSDLQAQRRGTSKQKCSPLAPGPSHKNCVLPIEDRPQSLIPASKNSTAKKVRRSTASSHEKMHVLGSFSESRALCNLAKPKGFSAGLAFLVSGLNAREINRHGAKRAQASTAELTDSRNSRKRPRARQGPSLGFWQIHFWRPYVTDNE